MTAFVTSIITDLELVGARLLSKADLVERKVEIPVKRMQFAVSISLLAMNRIGIKYLCTRLLRARYVPSFLFHPGEEPIFILHTKIRKRRNRYEGIHQ